jgi:hypothetical protein
MLKWDFPTLLKSLDWMQTKNRSGVDDRVPMLNHAAVEIGQQPGPNHSFRQTPIGAKPSAFIF